MKKNTFSKQWDSIIKLAQLVAVDKYSYSIGNTVPNQPIFQIVLIFWLHCNFSFHLRGIKKKHPGFSV